MKSIEIKTITWEQILPIWTDLLWPNRKSPIKPMSSMRWLGDGYDMNVYRQYTPVFYGAFVNGVMVGVNSIHGIGNGCRSRGLYVVESMRGMGIANLLLQHSVKEAQRLGFPNIWTCPRQSAMKAYEKVGFVQCSEFDNDLEFGPNCYAIISELLD